MWGKMTDNYNNTDQPKDSHDVLSTLPLIEYSFDRACFDLASQFEMDKLYPDGVDDYRCWINEISVRHSRLSPFIPAADINIFFEDEFVNRVWNAAMCGTLSSATGLLFRSVVDSLKINLNELLDNAAGIYRAELMGGKIA